MLPVESLISEQVIEHIPCGIVAFTDEGKMEYVNEYLCTLLQHTKAEIINRHIEDTFTISSKIFYQTHLFPLITLHGKAEEIFLTLKAKDGSHIPVLSSVVRTPDLNYCVFIPVWQRKKYEDEILEAKRTAELAIENNEMLNKLQQETELQLAESERQLRKLKQVNNEYVELNKIISHDLHEPIRKLMMFIDMLFENEQLIDRQKLNEQLHKMLSQATRLRSLTMHLQRYVEIDVANEPLSHVQLTQLVQQCFDNLSKQSGNENAIISFPQLPAMDCYALQLESLFTELLNNCFKFKKANEPLHIEISSTIFKKNIYSEIKDKYKYLDYVKLQITDNCKGIPSKYSEYIFGMFKKIDLQTEGAGFGLALCRKIVERHNGSIKAESKDGGAVFTVILPLQQSTFVSLSK